jgi:electron transfer flavoprotein alpha subunit
MAEILVYCDKNETACELISHAATLKEGLKATVAALVLTGRNEAGAEMFFSYGADKVYVVKSDALSDVRIDVFTDAVTQVVNKYQISILLMGSTKAGKIMAPMVAQNLGAGCITDAIDLKVVNGELVIDKYALGGNTVAVQNINTAVKVIAVMPRTFPVGEKKAGSGEIINVALQLVPAKLKVLEKQPKTGEAAPIEEAQTLICVGRGLADKKDIAIIQELAATLKAEIGATRPLTHDWQWFHESREVGLSGKKCKPRLCLSIGISGQIQHTVGIRNAKIIMAVNKDKNAPIFKIADYGLVADLYDVVPRLTKRLAVKG